jgi:hypothetical protein
MQDKSRWQREQDLADVVLVVDASGVEKGMIDHVLSLHLDRGKVPSSDWSRALMPTPATGVAKDCHQGHKDDGEHDGDEDIASVHVC